MGPDPLELFPFVVLAILMAMAGGISEHMLTSWSSQDCLNYSPWVKNGPAEWVTCFTLHHTGKQFKNLRLKVEAPGL